MKRLGFILTLVFTAARLFASPNLDDFSDIEGVRVYRDHAKSALFFLSPGPPALDMGKDKIPNLSFDLFRYHGRKGTSDAAEFRAKGILNIGLHRQRDNTALKKIKSVLKKKHPIKFPKLRSMPVEQTKGRLIFGETELNWSQPSQWSGKKISLSLAPDVSEILWSAIEAGQTLMSVEITQTLSGVRQNPDKKWEKAGVSMGATLPITLDMKAYPSLFRRIDLDGRMVRGYTGIDVFCFDFLEHLDDTLYSKVIDIAIPTTGNPLVETITFNQESDYRARVEFKLAKDLDTAYKIRITRVYMDGTTQQGTWVKRKGEAMLDITDYRGDDHGQDLEDENEQNTNE